MTDALTAHLRLSILRTLAGAPGYKANSSVIHSVATEFGLVTSRDRIRTELAWMAEQGLVACQDMVGLTVATLTERASTSPRAAPSRLACSGRRRAPDRPWRASPRRSTACLRRCAP